MKKYTSTIAAFLLIIAAVWNIKCESDKRAAIERQAQFQRYLVINSKLYKQSLKQDSLFAEKLDSIERQAKVLKFTTHKPYMPK